MAHLRLFRFLSILILLFSSAFSFADDKPLILDKEGYDETTPVYEQDDPHWGFGTEVAIRKFPFGGAFGSIYQLFGEYLFTLGKAGVVSLGAHGGIYPLDVLDELPVSYTNFGVGGQVRYQMKFMYGQWVVPTVAFRYTYLNLKGVSGGPKIKDDNMGLSYGLFFALNPWDKTGAREGYASLGLKRSYLTVEMMTYDIQTETLVTSGPAWLLGVRLEI